MMPIREDLNNLKAGGRQRAAVVANVQADALRRTVLCNDDSYNQRNQLCPPQL
jgi:hypothetical protein